MRPSWYCLFPTLLLPFSLPSFVLAYFTSNNTELFFISPPPSLYQSIFLSFFISFSFFLTTRAMISSLEKKRRRVIRWTRKETRRVSEQRGERASEREREKEKGRPGCVVVCRNKFMNCSQLYGSSWPIQLTPIFPNGNSIDLLLRT